MTKKDNLYSEVVINESPFYYDDHGRLRVHVLNEAQYISTDDMIMDPVTGKTGPSRTIKISKDITGMPTYGNDEPNSDMIARPAVMPPADRERPLPGTARIAVPRPDTARPPSNMKRPLPVRGAPATGRGLPLRREPATGRGLPLRPIGGRPGLGRLSPIRSIVGSGRNTNIRTGLRGVRPAARAMQKSAPATDYLNEKMNLKTAKMGDVIKDFQKSDAPQFEGKSKAKRRIMAIAAKLGAERMSERD